MSWLFWLWLVGFAALPMAQRLFGDHCDHGYVAGKILGWLGFAYIPWLAASMGIVSFGSTGPVIGLLAMAVAFVAFRPTKWEINWVSILRIELGFGVLFILGLAARLHAPDIAGLEKFMDLGFLASSMRAETMPPPDMWMSGETINYYYYGHSGAALWALLTNVSADHGYQLHMATLFGLTGLGVYRLVRELSRPAGRTLSVIGGITGTMLVLYAGNFHSVLYTIFRPLMNAVNPQFYYPDSTRFIGFDPITEDKAFTEFVAYGFHVGDMHAHVLATPIAVLTALVLLSTLRNNWTAQSAVYRYAILLGWLLGLSYMTNAWDLAINGLLALLTGAILLIRSRQPILGTVDRYLAVGMTCLAITFLTMTPFLNSFVAFVEGIRLVNLQTPFWQLLVIYGHGIFAIAVFFMLFITHQDRQQPEHVFTGVLAFTVVLLIAIPEFVYVKDAHGEDYARANTMFKLSFRSQMFLQISALVVVILLTASSRRKFILGCILSVPLISTFSYAGITFQSPGIVKNLDGLAFLKEERAIANFVNTLPLTKGEAILEAGGESFSDGGRISAVTGQPTVLGWLGHEVLWRGYGQKIADRQAAVKHAYESQNIRQLCDVLQSYNVRYIVVSQVEKTLYPDLQDAVFDQVGHTIYQTGAGRVIAPDPETCS